MSLHMKCKFLHFWYFFNFICITIECIVSLIHITKKFLILNKSFRKRVENMVKSWIFEKFSIFVWVLKLRDWPDWGLSKDTIQPTNSNENVLNETRLQLKYVWTKNFDNKVVAPSPMVHISIVLLAHWVRIFFSNIKINRLVPKMAQHSSDGFLCLRNKMLAEKSIPFFFPSKRESFHCSRQI